MSFETYNWFKAAHVFGFVLWSGMLIALSIVLRAQARADEAGRPALVGAARSLAMLMDIGATVAIACGVIMLVSSPAVVSPLKQPYFHIKLTAAVVILAAHVALRIMTGRSRRGRPSWPPVWFAPALFAVMLAIDILAIVRPFLKNG